MTDITPLPVLFVSYVGSDFINLAGEDCKKLSNKPGASFDRGRTTLRFSDEAEMLAYLQSLIDRSIPFQSTYKNDPARDALYYRGKGQLTGKIISFDWGAGGAIYKTE